MCGLTKVWIETDCSTSFLFIWKCFIENGEKGNLFGIFEMRNKTKILFLKGCLTGYDPLLRTLTGVRDQSYVVLVFFWKAVLKRFENGFLYLLCLTGQEPAPTYPHRAMRKSKLRSSRLLWKAVLKRFANGFLYLLCLTGQEPAPTYPHHAMRKSKLRSSSSFEKVFIFILFNFLRFSK